MSRQIHQYVKQPIDIAGPELDINVEDLISIFSDFTSIHRDDYGSCSFECNQSMLFLIIKQCSEQRFVPSSKSIYDDIIIYCCTLHDYMKRENIEFIQIEIA